MYEAHWGLRRSPFRAAADPGSFHPSPTHDEALARLHFMVEHGRHLGLMLGGPGSGKSLLLRVLQQQLLRQAIDTVYQSLLVLTPDETLYELAAGCGARPLPHDDRCRLWQRITDHAAQLRHQQRPWVILLDDADRADREVLGCVERLVRHASEPGSRITIVLSLEPERCSRLSRELLDLAELRIDVESWESGDTAEYLDASLVRAGGSRRAFSPEAAQRVAELARGVPRHVNQLADLALLAGAGRGLDEIDRETIDTVYTELCVGSGQ